MFANRGRHSLGRPTFRRGGAERVDCLVNDDDDDAFEVGAGAEAFEDVGTIDGGGGSGGAGTGGAG